MHYVVSPLIKSNLLNDILQVMICWFTFIARKTLDSNLMAIFKEVWVELVVRLHKVWRITQKWAKEKDTAISNLQVLHRVSIFTAF